MRGSNEAFEERPELSSANEVFRVPLNAQAKATTWIFNRFDHAIWRCRRRLQVLARRVHRLMMPTVDVNSGVTVNQRREK